MCWITTQGPIHLNLPHSRKTPFQWLDLELYSSIYLSQRYSLRTICDRTGFLMDALKQADGNQRYFKDVLML